MAEIGELAAGEGRLAENIVWFARALRRAGLPVGPDRVVEAVRAVEAAGIGERADFYWTLHASFVSRPEHRAVFAQVFRLFWRDPRYLEHMMAAMLPAIRGVQQERVARPGERRAAEALVDGVDRPAPEVEGEPEETLEVDAALTMSGEERLRTLDFEQMTADEMAAAKRMLSRLVLPVRPLPSRRMAPDARGRVADWRATMRGAMRRGGEVERLAMRRRRERWPDLVVLCDISGSMSAYSRAVLHFVHALANRQGAGWGRVHAFTFGTRLTNVTRHLRRRDADAALAAAGAEARDWEGGTRIGDSLAAFNRVWARRVAARGAVVLLVTDGLDRGTPELLEPAIERLHLTARRLIWLNPLLRWEGFAPRARGIATMLNHVDDFRAGHNVASLAALAEALSAGGGAGTGAVGRASRSQGDLMSRTRS